MNLSSPTFYYGQSIPRKCTGEGEDLSPPLEWSDAPIGTRAFALVCEDPDAPLHRGDKNHAFVHWVIYGISAETKELPVGLPRQEFLHTPIEARQGKNTLDIFGYSGPMPPVGHGPHRYIFTLYALDADIGLRAGATKTELLEAMQTHILAQASLKGIYERTRATGKISRSWRAPDLESRPSP